MINLVSLRDPAWQASRATPRRRLVRRPRRFHVKRAWSMTRKERRGKRLFVILATLIILHKLASIGFALAHGFAEVEWWKSVAQPAGFALAVALLWYGDVWLRWIIGFLCLLSGALPLYVSGNVLVKLAKMTPPEASGVFAQLVAYPVALVGVVSLMYVVAGLLFLFSPSLRAFFRYQRLGPKVAIGTVESRLAELDAAPNRQSE